MSADMTMTLIYDKSKPIQKVGARRVLETAEHGLRILNAAEKGLTGKRAQIVWRVNIYSFSDRAVVEFSAPGELAALVAKRAIDGMNYVFNPSDPPTGGGEQR